MSDGSDSRMKLLEGAAEKAAQDSDVVINGAVENFAIIATPKGLTMWLVIKTNGGTVAFGGKTLFTNTAEDPNENIKLGVWIYNILKTIGVEATHLMQGKAIRIKLVKGKCVALGNFLREEWFAPAEMLEEDEPQAQ